MKLDELVVRDSGNSMQPVDVLRDQAQKLAVRFEVADRKMRDVRLHCFVELIGCFLELPVTNPRRFAGHELVEINGLVPCPYAARTAKVGDAGFGADSGAGEKDDSIRRLEASCEFAKTHRRRRIISAARVLAPREGRQARWLRWPMPAERREL